MSKGKASKLVASAVAVSTMTAIIVMQCSVSASASRPSSQLPSARVSSEIKQQKATMGKVTAINGSNITLSILNGKPFNRGRFKGVTASSSSASSDSAAVTKTITVPAGCKITSDGASSTLSVIAVGSYIRVCYDRSGNVSSIAVMTKKAGSKSKYRPVSGQVTAVSGNQITLSVMNRKMFGRGFKPGSAATSSSASSGSAAVTKTITVPAGCKITSDGASATLSAITVGSYIRVCCDSNGNVSSIVIKNMQKRLSPAPQTTNCKNNKV